MVMNEDFLPDDDDDNHIDNDLKDNHNKDNHNKDDQGNDNHDKDNHKKEDHNTDIKEEETSQWKRIPVRLCPWCWIASTISFVKSL